MPRIATVHQAATGCGPGDTYHFYILTENGADLDSLPTVAASYHDGAADAALGAGFMAMHEAPGVYLCTLVTPESYAYCDEMLVRLLVAQGAITQSVVWAAMVSPVAFDASGGVILQPSEHISEIPQDILAALLQVNLAQYTNPAAPMTSALQITGAALVNSPASGGLTQGQVSELNAILDGVNRGVKAGDPLVLAPADEAALTSNTPVAVVSALMNKTIAGLGMTFGQELIALGVTAGKLGVINDLWHEDTHILDVMYGETVGGPVLVTNHVQYPASQVTNPSLLNVTSVLGTLPQP